jgi:prophage maintenance system killer protein
LFLLQNGYRLTASNADLADFALGVAKSRYSLEEIKTWLHEHIQSA